MRKHWSLVFLLSFVVACGQDDIGQNNVSAQEAFGSQDMAGDLASLLPADAHVVIYAKSMKSVDNIANLVSELTGEEMEYKSMMGMIGISPDQVDQDRPLAIAVKVMKATMPQPLMTLVLPVSDPPAVAKSAAPMFKAKEVGGKYVALSMDAQYAAGSSKLAKGMPSGDLVMRVDLAGAFALFKSDIESGLLLAEGGIQAQGSKMFPGADVAGMSKEFFKWVRDFIASSETLDIVARDAAPMISTDLIYTAKAGSTIADLPGGGSNLREMANHLTASHALTMLFKMDAKAFAGWSDAVVEFAASKLNAEQAKAYRAAMADSKKLMDRVGSDWGASFGVDDSGISVSMSGRATDAASFVKDYIGWFKHLEAMGAKWAPAEAADEGGTAVYRGTVKFDGLPDAREFQQVFPNGLDLAMAGSGETMTVTVGGASPAKLLEGGSPNDDLASALQEAKGTLGFLVQVEARGFMQGMADFARKMEGRAPVIPGGAKAPAMVFGTRNGRAFRIGFRMDARSVKTLIDDIEKAERARRR